MGGGKKVERRPPNGTPSPEPLGSGNGNSAYGAEISPLPNPVNATDIAATLQPLGFEVTWS